MKKRENQVFDQVVNQGLVMSKFKSRDEAMHMMIKAGLPRNVINRVLLEKVNVRSSDWH